MGTAFDQMHIEICRHTPDVNFYGFLVVGGWVKK